MSHRIILVVKLCFVVASVAAAPNAMAQVSQPKRAGDKEASLDRKGIDRAIKDLRVYLDKGKTKTLKPHTVLRWPNAVRGAIDGATAIWTDEGRPHLVYCIWTNKQQQIGLAAGPLSSSRTVVEMNGRMVWPPKRIDKLLTDFRDIPDAPPPAQTSRQRLLQMKRMAQRFKAKATDPGDAETFRLLPTPIYRYEIPVSGGSVKSGEEFTVLDGGVFAFVHGTDPETLLLIEARSSAIGYRWQYAAAARGVAVDLSLDGKRAASIPFCGTMIIMQIVLREGETFIEPVK